MGSGFPYFLVMSSLDQALAALLDPSSAAEVKSQAFAYVAAVKCEPGFVFFAMGRSLELDVSTPLNLHVAFFYLQAIEELIDHEYAQYTETQRSQVHQYLNCILSPQCVLLSVHSLLSKLAVIYVKVISLDFPEVWPLAFSQLLQAATPATKRFFLMVMKVANEDLLDAREDVVLPLAKKLKEEMRKRVVVDAAAQWKRYLEEDNAELATMTLMVLADYIDWIPLEVALEFTPYIQRFRSVASLKCLTSLVQKGMEPCNKLHLLQSLDLLPFLQALHVESLSFEVSDEPAAVAVLVNAVGMQLMEIGTSDLLFPTVSLALLLFSSPNLSISHIVLDFLTEYIHALKVKSLSLPQTPLTTIEQEHINSICVLVMRKCELPERFGSREEEEQFAVHRKELGQVFKSLVGVESMLQGVLEVLAKAVQEISTNLAGTRAQATEVVLFLLYHFAECVPDIHHKLAADNPFSRLIGFILASGIKELPHPVVIRQYLEMCIRYSSYFEAETRLPELVNVINPLLVHSASGDSEVAKHAIYMLYRLVLKMPKGIVSQAPVLLAHIQSLLSRPVEDQSTMYLAKSFGLLLANRSLALSTQQTLFLAYLRSLPSPLTTDQLSLAAEVVGGFQRQAPREIWEALAALAEHVNREVAGVLGVEMYKAVVYFYQKLLVALEDACSQALSVVLRKLYTAVSLDTLEDLLKVPLTQLLIHALQVLKGTLEVALPQEVVVGVVTGVISTIPCPTTCVSAEAMHLIDLRKTWLKLLDLMAVKGLDLLGVGEGLVEYLARLCENKYEVGVSARQSIKSGLALLNRLFSSVLTQPSESPYLHSVLPLAVRLSKSVFALGLNPKTVEATYILHELVNLHIAATRTGQRLGAEVSRALQEVVPMKYWKALLESTNGEPLLDAKSRPSEGLCRLRSLLLSALPPP